MNALALFSLFRWKLPSDPPLLAHFNFSTIRVLYFNFNLCEKRKKREEGGKNFPYLRFNENSQRGRGKSFVRSRTGESSPSIALPMTHKGTRG